MGAGRVAVEIDYNKVDKLCMKNATDPSPQKTSSSTIFFCLEVIMAIRTDIAWCDSTLNLQLGLF